MAIAVYFRTTATRAAYDEIDAFAEHLCRSWPTSGVETTPMIKDAYRAVTS